MKQLGIKIGQTAVFFPAEAAPLLAHLGGVYQAQQVYKEGRYIWEKSDDSPEILFLDTKEFVPEPEPMEKLRAEKEAATSQWLAQYRVAEDLKKQLAETKAKLAAIQEAAGNSNK